MLFAGKGEGYGYYHRYYYDGYYYDKKGDRAPMKAENMDQFDFDEFIEMAKDHYYYSH
uniref:Uncharacterized protein n=1 Tax=Ciona savignyi TaxID=51511 RepID=H2YL66_CIOSA